jgi:transposase-like protein
MKTNPKTLVDAIRFFSVPENCREYLVSRRWPDGVTCPTCGSKTVYFDSSRNGWECKTRHPKRKFTLKTGTIFEDSPLGLDKWLPAVWMIANMKNGVSSHELARSIDVTQKTAWFMLQRIRLAMQDDDNGGKLRGAIEVDETFIGGKARNMHQAKRERLIKGAGHAMIGKVAVMGLLQRKTANQDSTVRLEVVPNVRGHRLQGKVREEVERNSMIFSDALKSYRGLSKDYVHQVIDHAEQYADGMVHTNGLENFWSLLKRAITGTYVSIEPFHLFRYLDEQAFRFNGRKFSDADRFSLVVKGIVGRRLTYQDLIGPLNSGAPA